MNGDDLEAQAGGNAAATMDEPAAPRAGPSGDEGVGDAAAAEDCGSVEHAEVAAATAETISETKEVVREELGHGIDDVADISDVTTELLERVALLDQRTEEHSLVLERLEGHAASTEKRVLDFNEAAAADFGRLEKLVKSLAKSVDALSAGLTQALERLPKKPGPKPKAAGGAKPKGKPGPKPKAKAPAKPQAKKPGPKPKR